MSVFNSIQIYPILLLLSACLTGCMSQQRQQPHYVSYHAHQSQHFENLEKGNLSAYGADFGHDGVSPSRPAPKVKKDAKLSATARVSPASAQIKTLSVKETGSVAMTDPKRSQAEETVDVFPYLVKRGDTLSHIALRAKMSINQVKALNRSNPNVYAGKLKEGDLVLLPKTVKDLFPKVSKRPEPRRASSGSHEAPKEGAYYTVAQGDTLTHIAKRTGSKTRWIQDANHITDLNKIRPGQKLWVPGAKQHGTASHAGAHLAPKPQPSIADEATYAKGPGVMHVLESGQTIAHLSSQYKVSTQSILKANNIQNPKKLQVGQSLWIPNAQPSPSAHAHPATRDHSTAQTGAKVDETDDLFGTHEESDLTMEEMELLDDEEEAFSELDDLFLDESLFDDPDTTRVISTDQTLI